MVVCVVAFQGMHQVGKANGCDVSLALLKETVRLRLEICELYDIHDSIMSFMHEWMSRDAL